VADHIEREFDFVMVLEDMVLRGQIDLWFEEGGEPVIVDYKTDDVSAAEAPSRAQSYATQLQLYAIAIERLTGKQPARALLQFLRPNATVLVDVTGPALAAAAKLVGEFRQAQDRLDFPLCEGARCFRCPHFHGMCPSGAAPSVFGA
jgi:ATP-dependent helicase/nuclease subunit A